MHVALFLTASFLLSSATAPSGTALVVEPVASADAAAFAAKVSELLRAEIEEKGMTTLSEDELLARAGATQESVALHKAREALAKGKDEYLQLDMAAAVKTLGEARRRFQRALLETGVFEPYAETLAYQGAAYLDLEDEPAARAAFLDLVRVRPRYQLDPAVYAPQVLAAFERAREDAEKMPRGSLQIVSSPPLARVIVDGVERGETPLTVTDLLAGSHAVRVEHAGRSPWWGMVDVTAGESRVTVKLEEEVLAQRLAAFREVLKSDATRDVVSARATALLGAARADVVVALALERREPGFVASAALLSADEQPRVAWTAVDEDLFHAEEAAAALVRALLSATTDVPVFTSAGMPAPGRSPSFDSSLLGLGRPPARVAVAASASNEPAAVDEPPQEEGGAAGLWLGIGAGVLVAALVAGGAGVGVFALLQPPVETREPDTVRFDVGVRR